MLKQAERSRIALNKNAGAQFEKLFVHRATLGGMLALKNELSFRYQGGGKMLPIRTDLDFRLCNRDGQVAFLDCKSFDGDGFTYSQIDAHQLRRARSYEAYRVIAGFVVWLKQDHEVVFFAGCTLAEMGPRSRFTRAHGILLGSPMTFDLHLVFSGARWLT